MIADVPPGNLNYVPTALVVTAGVMPLGEGGLFLPMRPVSGAEAFGRPRAPGGADPMTLTVANQLTLLRMLLIPAFVILVVYD